MPRIARPTRTLAGAIVLTSFGIGFTGAYGAHDLDTRIAVDDARAAAESVEAKRDALELSLTEAHSAVHAAGAVVDEDRVAAAAQALSDATHAATEQVALSGVQVSVAPVDPDEITTLVAVAAAPPSADGSAEGAEPVTNRVSPGEHGDDEPAAEPSDSAPTPSPTPSTAPIDDAPHPAPRSDELVDLIEDLEVARVLAGETDSADQAREAAQRLERASAALDEALASVNGGATALTEAAIEAGHADTILLLDGAVRDADVEAGAAVDVLAAVADKVNDDSRLTEAEDALTSLMSASARAALVDHERPLRVIAELDRILAAHTAFDDAMAAVRVTHEEWVTAENADIETRNDRLRADHEQEVADARQAHAQRNRDAVASRSNGWSGPPAGVAGSNGSLTYDSLCELDFAPGHRLQCDAARSLEAANAAYLAQHGTNLAMTDSYRSYSLQVRTRAAKPGTAAKPGSSNHGWGMAVDLDVPSSAWLTANGAEYGWVHPAWARPGGPRPESWHLEYVATDVGAFQAPAAPELEKPIQSVFDGVAPRDD
ncbi:hypothetical protein [Demequina sp. SO4-18]|uniref:hypothetical protein n=1 Tax=Demequina sp. SO4-18 TaxID=3401026 RepID=UPI003B5AD785